MNKSIFFTTLFFIFFIQSSKLIARKFSVPTRFSTHVQIAVWKQAVKALKKLAQYATKSKQVHGASIGVVSSGTLHVALKAIKYHNRKYQPKVILIQNHTKKHNQSFLGIILASIYGAYLSDSSEKMGFKIGLRSLVASLLLGIVHTISREIKENVLESEEPSGHIENCKNGLRQALLCAVSFITSFYATQKLKTLDY
ncbi:hypothetical protein KKA53_00540 [Candidatus Dependentiae bacterium]|nr:hypothetical protein [Candidatus Dependentiae bacterium]